MIDGFVIERIVVTSIDAILVMGILEACPQYHTTFRISSIGLHMNPVDKNLDDL